MNIQLRKTHTRLNLIMYHPANLVYECEEFTYNYSYYYCCPIVKQSIHRINVKKNLRENDKFYYVDCKIQDTYKK